MKILIAHNHYGDHATGGEAMVFNAEAELLENNGFNIRKYEKTNSDIENMNIFSKLNKVKNIHWSEGTIVEAGKIMDEFQPDILHVHNYKFAITPSIFQAAKDRGIKTVLTLHNFRLMVPCGNFMTKEGNICELCLTGSPKNILIKRCAQGSALKSYLQYRLFTKTKYKLNQLADLVDKYVVLTEFSREKLIQAGVNKEKIFIKPNFISPLNSATVIDKVERAVFIGRLSFEKGILQLLDSWKNINYPLVIIGTGPLEEEALNKAKKNSNITLLGNMHNDDVREFLKNSAFMVFPSTLYEGLGMTILEAMSLSVPVIASNLGTRPEVIDDKKTGVLYDVDNQHDFIEKVELLIKDKAYREELGNNAKLKYSSEYTPTINLTLMKRLYSDLLRG